MAGKGLRTMPQDEVFRRRAPGRCRIFGVKVVTRETGNFEWAGKFDFQPAFSALKQRAGCRR